MLAAVLIQLGQGHQASFQLLISDTVLRHGRQQSFLHRNVFERPEHILHAGITVRLVESHLVQLERLHDDGLAGSLCQAAGDCIHPALSGLVNITDLDVS